MSIIDWMWLIAFIMVAFTSWKAATTKGRDAGLAGAMALYYVLLPALVVTGIGLIISLIL